MRLVTVSGPNCDEFRPLRGRDWSKSGPETVTPKEQTPQTIPSFKIDLPAGAAGALIGTSIYPAGAAGTPKIDKIEIAFKIDIPQTNG